MAKLLIAYVSKHGQTGKIADALAVELGRLGHQVEKIHVGKRRGVPVHLSADGVLIGAPVYGRKYPAPIRRWIARELPALSEKPSAFFSVCLGVLEKENEKTQADERAIVQELFSESGWRPRLHAIFAGALSYSDYSWPVRWVMKRISRKAGGNTDTSRDHEYTDWNEVRAFAREFDTLVRYSRPETRAGWTSQDSINTQSGSSATHV